MKATSRIKKVLPAGFMAVLLAFCLVLLPGCGKSADDLITENLTTQLDAFKNVDESIVEEISKAADDQFGSIGLDASEYVSALLDGFDYTIGDITVDGDTATVALSVTAKSLSDVGTKFMTEYTNRLNSMDVSSISDESQLYSIAGDALMSAIKEVEPKTVECTVAYSKDEDGNWSPDASIGSTIYSAIDAGQASAQ